MVFARSICQLSTTLILPRLRSKDFVPQAGRALSPKASRPGKGNASPVATPPSRSPKCTLT
jgi:hypothetical protein